MAEPEILEALHAKNLLTEIPKMCYIFGNLGVQGYPIRNSHRNLIRFDPKSIKIQNVMDK